MVCLPESFTSISLNLSKSLRSVSVEYTNEYKKPYSMPATPSRTRFSAVIVPVLSKQHTSTLPAEGIRNGSVQKMAIDLFTRVRFLKRLTYQTWKALQGKH